MSGEAGRPAVELVVTGRIATLAGEAGFGWVEALAIGGGRVVAAGSLAEVGGLGSAGVRRLDLGPDEVAIPGLTDSHLHLADAALAGEHVDLEGALTLADGLAAVAAAHAALDDPDAWIEGRGWDSDRWLGWPTAAALERVAPGRRVALWAHDHHALWVSRRALAEAGIDAAFADPPGGQARRDEVGEPTGVLHEAAAGVVAQRVESPDDERLGRAVERLGRDLATLGVVAVHDPAMLLDPERLGYHGYVALAEAGRLRVRVHAGFRREALAAVLETGHRSGDALDGGPSPRVRLGWLKLFADGTLGSRTAALLEPFELEPDRPLAAGTERGVFVTPPADLRRFAAEAAAGGIATQIHGIGDAAVRAALDALAPTAGRVPLMPRVEHVQLCDPADRARFGDLGIAASVQPIHLRSDAAQARLLWGERAERASYAWGSLAAAGAVVAFGTDAPVEPVDPWPGIALAVTRWDPTWEPGTPPFGPAEAMDLATALRAACVAPARTAAEPDRGRLTPGQRADLVVLPVAALREPVEPGGPLATARPRLVLIDGAVAHEA